MKILSFTVALLLSTIALADVPPVDQVLLGKQIKAAQDQKVLADYQIDQRIVGLQAALVKAQANPGPNADPALIQKQIVVMQDQKDLNDYQLNKRISDLQAKVVSQ